MINSKLFKNFTEQEFKQSLIEPNSIINKYNKDSFVFSPGDVCDKTYVPRSGKLSLEKTNVSGKNTVVNIFKSHGEMVAEVYSYLNEISNFTSVCNTDCEALEVPVRFFDISISSTPIKNKIMTNLVTILAEKVFFLNSKVKMLSSFSLRQKIATFLIQTEKENVSNTGMTRQQMADFLATTRPSLFRELLSMEDSGLTELNGSETKIKNREELESLL